MCTAPCDVVVPSAFGYRLNGEGLRPSGKFTLDVGTHVIDADLGSKTSWSMAPWFVIGGLALAAGGGVMAWKGTNDASSSSTATVEGDTTLRDVGYVVLGVGVVIALAGTIVLAANGNSVEIDGKAIASRKSGSGFALTPNGFVF